MQGGTLRAQRLDIEHGRLTGDPVTLADPVAYDPAVYAGGFSVSDGGMLAYRRGGGAQRRQLAWFDRAGKALGLLGTPDENNMLVPRVSPDGRRVAVFRTVQGNTDIWLLDGTRASRFTFDVAVDQYEVWSPDGARIAFDSNRAGVRDIYIKPAVGVGAEERLVESPQLKTANDWSQDGRFLLFHSIDPQSDRDLWVVPLDGNRTPWVFLKTNFNERWAKFSPDGRMMAAPIRARGAVLEPGAPVALFPTRIVFGGVDLGLGRQYDVARDGRFLINTVSEDAAAAAITILQNWQPPAK